MNQELQRTAHDIVNHAVKGEDAQAIESLGRIINGHTLSHVYGVCCAIAEQARTPLHRMFPAMIWQPSAFVYLRDLDQDENADDPISLWSARFVVAQTNRDTANREALFLTAFKNDPQRFPAYIISLIGQTAALVRHAATLPPTTGGTNRAGHRTHPTEPAD